MGVTTLSLRHKNISVPLSEVNVEGLLHEEGRMIVALALSVIESNWANREVTITSTRDAIDYFTLRLVEEKQEVFAVLFLDNKHRVIAYEPLFRGSINGASVYPRTVAQKSLEHNAAALIVAHNHPSGVCEPSQSDTQLTYKLTEVLRLIDVKLLDHLVIAAEGAISMADKGLM